MSISIEHCSFVYPGTDIGVRDVSLSAEQGELVAIIGSSGSGKTTMLKLVAGFEHADAGTICIKGRNMEGIPARLRNVGMVFQSYALFPLMTCVENVAYPLKIRNVGVSERRLRALDMLDKVGLAAFADRLPGSMSGGQQQRVALARALVFQPDVMLLDEPLSALDASLRVELRREIRNLQKEQGIAALHVTHDQEEALSMADKVALMHQGRLIQVAAPQELYDAPNSRRVAAFVGHANLWSGSVVGENAVLASFGEVRCDTGAYRPGDKVTILVRPERVQINPLEKMNVFSGRIESESFLGAVRRYHFAVDRTGERILGETSSRAPFCKVGFPPEAVLLLPFEDDE